MLWWVWQTPAQDGQLSYMVTQCLMTRYSIFLIAHWHTRGSFNNGLQFSTADMAWLQNPWDLCCDSPAGVYHKFLMAFPPYSSLPPGQMDQVTDLNASLLGLSRVLSYSRPTYNLQSSMLVSKCVWTQMCFQNSWADMVKKDA